MKKVSIFQKKYTLVTYRLFNYSYIFIVYIVYMYVIETYESCVVMMTVHMRFCPMLQEDKYIQFGTDICW